MHRMRAAVLIVSAALIAAVAVVAFMAASGTGDSPTAQAAGKATLTPTPGPAPTPKPTPIDDALTGVYDIMIPGVAATEGGSGTCVDGIDNDSDGYTDFNDIDCHDKSIGLYACIGRQEHRADDSVKMGVVCYVDNPLLDDPSNIMPDLPGEGDDMVPGAPPPPPYGGTKAKSYGAVVAGDLNLTTCFEANGTSGNIIAVTSMPNAVAQQTAQGGKTAGTLNLYTGQSDASCAALTPSGTPLTLPIQATRADSGNSPIRPGPEPGSSNSDYDADGCSDWDELDKADVDCGDDPFNPYDGATAVLNLSGSYSLTAEAAEADYDEGTGTPIPGAYYACLADMQEDPDNVLNAKVMCYIDIPGVPVNPEAGATSGDGLSGGMPPEPYADVSSVGHTELTGVVDETKGVMELAGCFADDDGTGPLGAVYISTHWLDINTMEGQVWIWILQPDPQCAGSPVGTPVLAKLTMTRQATKDGVERDTDGDGCSNKKELGNTPNAGGLRDPYNHWDYFNPTGDGLNRVDDILKVVGQYFKDYPAANYTRTTDRTAVIGANPWNLNKPNGQQRVDDILAAVKSYFHDCPIGPQHVPDDDPQFDAQTGQ